jgi:uncharacterized membrane protein YqaE (UPF0057 family)
MRYPIAIVCPPLAVLLCGKPAQALLNCLLTLCLWVPGILHACMVVGSHQADLRTDRVVAGQRRIVAAQRRTGSVSPVAVARPRRGWLVFGLLVLVLLVAKASGTH